MLNFAASGTDLAAAVLGKKRSWRCSKAEKYGARCGAWFATPTAGRVGGTGRNLPPRFATSSVFPPSEREKLSLGCLCVTLPQARQAARPKLLLKAAPHSTQAWSIPHLRSFQQRSAPFPPTAISRSRHRDLLSYPVHLQSCCFVSNRRVKEVAIYRPHLLSSPLLQQHKQLLPRSLIIHNLLLPAWLASILPIWCFSWTPTPSLPASLTACEEILFHLFFLFFFPPPPFNLSC